MKKYVFLTLILALFISLGGCSAKKYRDDVSCKTLVDSVSAKMPEELDFLELDESFREFYFEGAEEYDDCYIVYSSPSEDISEIGIFHAVSDQAAEKIEGVCYEYIVDLGQNSRAFIASYAPEELTKLDGAEVRRYGRYVVYTVLDASDAERVFESVENALSE